MADYIYHEQTTERTDSILQLENHNKINIICSDKYRAEKTAEE